jgi:hypothetical protein
MKHTLSAGTAGEFASARKQVTVARHAALRYAILLGHGTGI